MKKLLLLIALVGYACFAQAQLLKKMKEKVDNKVNATVDKKVNDAVNGNKAENKSEENKTDALNNPVTIYKRDKNVCATRSFSENVTGIQKDIYGIAVTGDDRSLSAAVKNDLTGISYSNLGLVYNIHTRKVADSIAVIPIDLNENGKIDNDEKIYSSLDELLNFLGITGNAKIPQENVNIVFNKNTISKPAIDFLNWIITAGQQYNRQFGFLSLDKNVVLQQQHLLSAYISNAKNTVR